MDEYIEKLKEDKDYLVWHENRIHHMLDELSKNYSNYLIHTSKVYHIYRVTISAQFWMVNELLNNVDMVFIEKGYTYEPVSIESSYLHQSNIFNIDEATIKKMKESSLVEEMSFDKKEIHELISTQNFRGMNKREKNLLISKHNSIKTFTGTPFDINKSSILVNFRNKTVHKKHRS